VRHTLETALAAARTALAADDASVDERLRRAYDEWVGRYVGRFGADASDLMAAAESLIGTLGADYEKLFVEAVGAALREAGLAASYKPFGITPRQLAETLCATARGLKHSCSTREEFGQAFAAAVRIVCAQRPQAG
jgi:hypothetical protein